MTRACVHQGEARLLHLWMLVGCFVLHRSPSAKVCNVVWSRTGPSICTVAELSGRAEGPPSAVCKFVWSRIGSSIVQFAICLVGLGKTLLQEVGLHSPFGGLCVFCFWHLRLPCSQVVAALSRLHDRTRIFCCWLALTVLSGITALFSSSLCLLCVVATRPQPVMGRRPTGF